MVFQVLPFAFKDERLEVMRAQIAFDVGAAYTAILWRGQQLLNLARVWRAMRPVAHQHGDRRRAAAIAFLREEGHVKPYRFRSGYDERESNQSPECAVHERECTKSG